MSESNSNYSHIVVTGAAGWLGRNLIQALLNGLADCEDLRTPPFNDLPILAVDIGEIPINHERIQSKQIDLRKPEDCEAMFNDVGKDALVLHCAGLIHPKKTAELHQVNLQGTINLFEAARKAAVKRVVALSSNSPCGCNPQRSDRFDEESPYRPYMEYGRSKMLMEQHVKGLSEDYPDWVLIRAPWFYGPLQPPRQSLFFSMIRNGKGPIVGDGDNKRSMAYTDNLAQGLLRAALVPQASKQIYWIADEEPYTMNQIIDTIERLLEEKFNLPCKRKRLKLPSIASEVAYVIDTLLQKAGLYHQKFHVLSEMNKTIACDVDKAKRELGYAPAISLEEGMRRSIRDVIERGGKI